MALALRGEEMGYVRKIAANKGGRNHLDAEIRASNAIALYLEINFARSSKLKNKIAAGSFTEVQIK
jgi:hypothetical protein